MKTLRIMFCKLVLLLIVLLPLLVKSQIYDEGIPIITNYTPKEYKAHMQNWSVIQGIKGHMYIGNHMGVLEFEGNNWRNYPTSNHSTVRSLATNKKGIIFVGAINQFGYLATNQKGKTRFISLKNKVPEKHIKFNDIWRTFCTGEGTYFFAIDKIFHYHNDTITVIPFEGLPLFGSVFDDQLFIIHKKKGICLIKNDSLIPLPHSNIFNIDFGRTVIQKTNKNKLIICSSNKGFYEYNLNLLPQNQALWLKQKINSDILKKVSTETDKFILFNGVYSATKINETQFAWGTINGGIIITDEQFNLIRIINKNRGLLNNSILDLYLDNNKVLWAVMPNGISKIEINSPLTLFNENSGLFGSVNSTRLIDGIRFVATMQGLYYLPPYKPNIENDIHSFKPMLSQTFFCWDMIFFKNNLLTTIVDGEIGRVNNNQIANINFIKSASMYCFGISKKFPDYFFVGLQDGFAVVETDLKNKMISIKNQYKIKEINEPIRKITEDNAGNLWLTTNHNGLLYLKFENKNIEKYQLFRYDTLNGLPRFGNQFVESIDNNLYACGYYGIYKAEYTKMGDSVIKFFKDTTFGEEYTGYYISQLFKKNAHTYWINKANADIAILKKNNQGRFIFQTTPLKKIMATFKHFQEENGFMWISSSEGLYRFNPNTDYNIQTNFTALIKKILVKNDTVLLGNYYDENSKVGSYYTSLSFYQPKSLKNQFDAENNSISFYFSSLYYDNASAITYKFKLEGFEEKWSDWTSELKKEYTNLPSGTFTFQVKAKNIYENESEIASYTFTILTPWYKTIPAMIMYLIIFSLLLYFGVKLYVRNLQAANVKLEKMVQERTVEIREQNTEILQQKEELKYQAELLEITNKELEKLSIVASETDNAIEIFDKNGDLEWVNRAFTKFYGYEIDEYIKVKGKNLFTLSSNKNLSTLVKYMIETKESVIYEANNITKSGESIWVQTTITPFFDSNNELSKFIAIESDISKVKQAEFDIIHQNEEILAQRDELERKNNKIEEINEQITGSIRYAQTIQEAILPSNEHLRDFFDCFIIYKPKDIVSGDFYWLLSIPTGNDKENSSLLENNMVFIAVADCTGHGVPGAFMSMIGSRLLNEITTEYCIYEPNQILESLDEAIRLALKQNNSDNRDGMDIALCRFEKDREVTKLTYSGSKTSVFFYFSNKKEIFVSKTDRKAVGGRKTNIEDFFINHEIFLNKGDKVYMVTDGYLHQNNFLRKKFGTNQFSGMLKSIAELPMQEQKISIENRMNEWMVDTIQRDDITVLGLRIE